MKGYHNLYLKCDVLCQLMNLNIEKQWLKIYGLCPNPFFSAQTLSWDVMLNKTRFESELISDADMYFLSEKGTRGEFS